MERFGALGLTPILSTTPVLLGASGSISANCDTAIVDITNLDELRYCFVADDHAMEDVRMYLDRFPNGATAEQEAFKDQLIAYVLAKFELIRSIRVSPGTCHIHIYSLLFLIRNRMKIQFLFAFSFSFLFLFSIY